MSSVTIGGVEYLPASKLAKEHRYTTDYIGQLCRSKKVDAQLVGRTWYVNPMSLDSHKKSRYTKVISSEKITKIPINNELSRVSVQPTLSKSTVKMSEDFSHNFSSRLDAPGVRYEDDNLELLPQLDQKSKQTKITVGLADSIDISVKNKSKITNMVPTAMPEVTLKGNLKVASLDEVYEIEDDKTNDVNQVLGRISDPIAVTTEVFETRIPEKPLPQLPVRPKFIKKPRVDRAVQDAAFTYKIPVTVEPHAHTAPTAGFSWKLFFLIVVAVVLISANIFLGSELRATSLSVHEALIFAPLWQ